MPGFSRHCPCNLPVSTGINADGKSESCPARISHKLYYSKVRNVYLQMKYIVKYGQPYSNQLADKKIRSLAGKIMVRQ